ncbi:MAG: hypothetical protein MZV70_63345 [Desulfobacterales bacterium]|nr:hypothetical protein [Desulfobacterales bacterium]
MRKTSKSLNISHDQRDPLAALTIEVVEQVDAFRGMVDFERISIPIRSAKMFWFNRNLRCKPRAVWQ